MREAAGSCKYMLDFPAYSAYSDRGIVNLRQCQLSFQPHRGLAEQARSVLFLQFHCGE